MLAATLFAVASVSDFYDGYLARRWAEDADWTARG